jgi:hypothetical protein
MKKLMHLFMFATIFFTLAACGGDSSSTAGKTTVLVYMEGTNLEADDANASMNLYEMITANASPNVTIVLATGAAYKRYSGPVKSWMTLKYHVISNRTIEEVQDLGNFDMGNPDGLREFIEWGQGAYPADRYILVFWDHGGGALGGFGGYKKEDSSPEDFPVASNLNLNQLRDVVDANVQKTGKKFELIGFDACMMGTMEVANSFKNSSRYMVASQDLEPGVGWDWKAMMNFIVANPDASGAEIGKAIANAYLAKLELDQSASQATLSVIDLAMMEPLNTALAGFSEWQQSLLIDTEAWLDLAVSRSSAMDFYASELDLDGSVDMVDTVSLLDKISVDHRNVPEIVNLKKALEKAVIHKVAGESRTSASGLSLMFPTYTVWSLSNISFYEKIAPVSAYGNLVTSYSDFARNKVKQIAISAPLEINLVIKAAITPADYKYEMAYIAIKKTETVDAKILEYYSGHQPIWPVADPATLSYAWDAKWFTLSGKIVSVFADPFPIPSNLNALRLRIPLFYNGHSGLYHLDYDFVQNKVIKYYGFLPDLNKQASRGFDPLPPGAEVAPLEFKKQEQFPFGVWVKGSLFLIDDYKEPAKGPKFERTALPADTYDLGFVLYDLTLRPSYSATIRKTIDPAP